MERGPREGRRLRACPRPCVSYGSRSCVCFRRKFESGTVTEKEERARQNLEEEAGGTEDGSESGSDLKELDVWLQVGSAKASGSSGDGEAPQTEDAFPDSRLGRIRQSHALLQQFTPKELKILKGLKRNTSPKAWTLREDLVVLTLNLSNREIAEILTDRNKEAVKKRLQLLRSKGLAKRPPIQPAPQA